MCVTRRFGDIYKLKADSGEIAQPDQPGQYMQPDQEPQLLLISLWCHMLQVIKQCISRSEYVVAQTDLELCYQPFHSPVHFKTLSVKVAPDQSGLNLSG